MIVAKARRSTASLLNHTKAATQNPSLVPKRKEIPRCDGPDLWTLDGTEYSCLFDDKGVCDDARWGLCMCSEHKQGLTDEGQTA